MTMGGSQVSSIAIRRFLPDSTWMRSAVSWALSRKSWWAFLKTFSRSSTLRRAHCACATRAAANARSMSAGLDWGSSTSFSPV